MSVRAANVFVQQSQKLKVTKHRSAATLFLVGIAIPMTNDPSGGGITDEGMQSDNHTDAFPHIGEKSGVRIRQSDVSNNAKFHGCDTEYVTKKGQAKIGELREILKGPEDHLGDLPEGLSESTIKKVQELRSLVVFNKHLSIKIARATKEANPLKENDEHTYIQAVEDYLSICEEYILRSPDEATAAGRLQELIAIKLYHMKLLPKVRCAESAATQIWTKYLHMAPRQLILEHFEKKRRLTASTSTACDEADPNELTPPGRDVIPSCAMDDATCLP
eukprot:Blabericola_migrator_1__9376@NODE_505_length_7965_cov_11_786781_g387_i0_p2_GENE_NODE_505_length_7965_cov_11_786781_g387_i0NODE_505_length_7965_cov_11_786781_g387_i0_p2_ORF_typecomplete_len276_score45_77_NODE_505_length_7965_cov_11_786781_g387_i047315558